MTDTRLCPDSCLIYVDDAANGEGEDAAWPPIVPLEPPSCLVGEWEEWSACNATCHGPDNDPQRFRKRVSVVNSDSFGDTGCDLEEKESCGSALELCSSYCWTAEWTDWSECATFLVGSTVVSAKRRHKPVVAGADFCDPDVIQEVDECRKGQHVSVQQVYLATVPRVVTGIRT